MNEVDSIRLEKFRQLRKEIRGSKDYLIVGIDVAKDKHHAFFGTATGESLLGRLVFENNIEGFEKLVKLNIQYFKKAGVKTIVTTCPECFRTLKKDYPEHAGEFDIEVLFISELVEDLVKDNKLRFNGEKQDLKITYQDPCRLGRHMGIYDSPRNVVSNICQLELNEMERNRERSQCCGVSAWTNCKSHSKQMQIDRLMEAKATGADILMTACPKCNIHLKCSVHNEIPVERDKVAIEILDFTEIIKSNLKAGVNEDGK